MLLSAPAPRPFHHRPVLACAAAAAAPGAGWGAPRQSLRWLSDGLLLVYELLPPFPLPNEAAGVETGIEANSSLFPNTGEADPVRRPRSHHALSPPPIFFVPIPKSDLIFILVLCAPLFTPQPPGDERRTPLAGTFVGNHITFAPLREAKSTREPPAGMSAATEQILFPLLTREARGMFIAVGWAKESWEESGI